MSNSGQIQPSSSGGQISRFDPVNNANDLLNNINKCGHIGEKIGQIKALAEQNPAVAFTSFVTILGNQTLLPMRALAIRGFGWIEHKATKADIAACQSEYSQQLLKLLSAEVLGKGKHGADLLRWAAADAIDGINFDAKYLHHPEYGNLHEPTAWLAKEILERKRKEINQVNTLDSRGDKTVEYQRHLQFWIYGPTVELFKENSSTQNYRYVVSDVLLELQELGIILALDIPQSERPNYIAQEAALGLADGLYRRYVEIQQTLYGYLEQFLLDDLRDVKLRISAAHIIKLTSNWKPLADKLNLLSRMLLWQEELRNEGLQILGQDKQVLAKVNIDADNLIEALEYQYFLNKPNTEDLTLTQIDNHLKLAEQKRNDINYIFWRALQSADKLSNQYKISASTVKTFISGKQNLYLSDINQWVKKLEEQGKTLKTEQERIRYKQSLLDQVFAESEYLGKKFIDALISISKQEDRNSQNYQTYRECTSLITSLLHLKNAVINNLEKEVSTLIGEKELNLAVGLVCLFPGFLIPLWTYYSPEIVMFYRQQGFTWMGSLPTNYSSYTNANANAWYATGFPKSQCGSQSNASCWYPVFVKYSDDNWRNILSKHCQDIGGNDETAALQSSAEKGQIQVASFDNYQDAEGFASYISSQYGSGWVGEKTCY